MADIQTVSDKLVTNKPYWVEFEADYAGGQWAVSHNPENSGVEVQDPTDGGDTSSPSIKREFIITAAQPGEHTVSFAYQRPWEDTPKERVDLVLNVVEPTAS